MKVATKEDFAVGSWLSASLDDTTGNVCDEMKKDVRAWFDSFDVYELPTELKLMSSKYDQYGATITEGRKAGARDEFGTVIYTPSLPSASGKDKREILIPRDEPMLFDSSSRCRPSTEETTGSLTTAGGVGPTGKASPTVEKGYSTPGIQAGTVPGNTEDLSLGCMARHKPGNTLIGPSAGKALPEELDESWDGIPEVAPSNPKQAYGDKKIPLHLVPPVAIAYMGMGLREGAKKYGPYNWRETDVEVMTYLGAALRHIGAFIDREDTDPESGNPHLAHAMASLAILVDAYEGGTCNDNRPPPGPMSQVLSDAAK